MQFQKRLSAITCLVFSLSLQGELAAAPTPWPTAGWSVSTPEEQGMSSNALADLVDFGAANEMDSLLAIRHGQIVVEAHYAPFRPGIKHVVNSATKAIIGTLAGIAFKEGVLGPLEQPVVELFPERRVANVDANKKAMTLSSLLDLTSGLDWREPLTNAVPETMLQMTRSRDWAGFVLDRPMAQAPGLAFNYNSGSWHLLSAILTKQTQRNTLDYAKQTLFMPLGITDVTWQHDPQGIPIGGFGLFMYPRDMAKIGYLYLHQGRWAEQQILDPGWVDRVNDARVDMHLGTSPSFHYAAGWWTIPEKHAYMAVGYLRQLIVVLPDTDAVAVVTGKMHYPIVALIDRINGAVKSETKLAPDLAASTRLAERVKDAATEKPSAVGPASALARTVSGKSYRFQSNALGMKAFVLDLVSSKPGYELSIDGSMRGMPDLRLRAALGLDGFFRSDEKNSDQLVAAKGRWLDESSFEIVSHALSEGIVTTSTLRFHGDEVDVDIKDNRGVRGRLVGSSRN